MKSGDCEQLKEALQRQPHVVKEFDSQGCLLLHVALMNKCSEDIVFCIFKGQKCKNLTSNLSQYLTRTLHNFISVKHFLLLGVLEIYMIRFHCNMQVFHHLIIIVVIVIIIVVVSFSSNLCLCFSCSEVQI